MMDMTKKQEKLLKEVVEVSGCGVSFGCGVMDLIGVVCSSLGVVCLLGVVCPWVWCEGLIGVVCPWLWCDRPDKVCYVPVWVFVVGKRDQS